MSYDIKLNLPKDWIVESDVFDDESGVEISHVSANLAHGKAITDGFIDIYVGEMPEGETAEDQAFANYAESVGFYDDDPEGFNPIEKFKFNGKNAWGFEGLSEDDKPLKLFTQEVKKGALAVVVAIGKDEKHLAEVLSLIERGFRVA